MKKWMRMPQTTMEMLRCPICHAKFKRSSQQLECVSMTCNARFPMVDEIPILINENTSIFLIDDVVLRKPTFFKPTKKIRMFLKKAIPSITLNFQSKNNYAKMIGLLMSRPSRPKILVIGGGVGVGSGIECLMENDALELIESDVSFGPRTMAIFDAHEIPFEDGSFDAVVVQAVLEHVVDPYKCVEELHRVLKNDGLVYSETPFMQQVHGRQFDFTRFTHLGHRRLFRKFDEIESGVAAGPGTALAWAYKYFLLSFTSSKMPRSFISAFANCTAFFLKYFDLFLAERSGAFDAASGYYFLGKKSSQTLSDKELIKLYRGAC